MAYENINRKALIMDKLTLKYDKYSMQWLIKIGRLTIFATDNYATATEFIKQHQADADADRKTGDNIWLKLTGVKCGFQATKKEFVQKWFHYYCY